MNKSEELIRLLKKELSAGKYLPGSRFPSEPELAVRFKVSRITVGRVMASLVSEGLIQRHGRGSGTTVASPKNFSSGFLAVVADTNSSYSSSIVRGVVQNILKEGLLPVLLEPEPEDFVRCAEQLEHSDCRGIFTMSYGMIPSAFTKPVIHLDSLYAEQQGCNHLVTCDNFGGAEQMMKKILASGRKEIVCVTMHSFSRELRRKGFLSAMKKAGLTDAEQRCFIPAKDTFYSISTLWKQIQKQYPKVDFIATDSDDLVFQFLRLFRSLGIRCPEEIGLSGFGNIHGISDLYEIPTVEQHPWHIGEAAVKGMMQILNCGEPESPLSIQIPVELIRTDKLQFGKVCPRHV